MTREETIDLLEERYAKCRAEKATYEGQLMPMMESLPDLLQECVDTLMGICNEENFDAGRIVDRVHSITSTNVGVFGVEAISLVFALASLYRVVELRGLN